MSTKKTVKLSIPNSSEFVSVVRLAVSSVAARMDFSVEDLEDIKIALSEACTNAVQYAYGSKSGQVDITCHLMDDKLEIEIQDQGCGFDITKLKSGEVKEPSDKNGLGLGLMFLKTLMDEADIQSKVGKGTLIKMAKYKPA